MECSFLLGGKRVVGKEVVGMSPILKANLPGILISLAGLIIEVIFNSDDE